jgi:hypothetical protein
MIFTDDDLKRLKEDLQKHIVIDLIQDNGLRLLARLEAAESLIGWNIHANGYDIPYNKWRKVAGKDSASEAGK